MPVEVAPRFSFGATALPKASAEVVVSVVCFGFQCTSAALRSVATLVVARGPASCSFSLHSFIVSMLWCAVLCVRYVQSILVLTVTARTWCSGPFGGRDVFLRVSEDPS